MMMIIGFNLLLTMATKTKKKIGFTNENIMQNFLFTKHWIKLLDC